MSEPSYALTKALAIGLSIGGVIGSFTCYYFVTLQRIQDLKTYIAELNTMDTQIKKVKESFCFMTRLTFYGSIFSSAVNNEKEEIKIAKSQELIAKMAAKIKSGPQYLLNKWSTSFEFHDKAMFDQFVAEIKKLHQSNITETADQFKFRKSLTCFRFKWLEKTTDIFYVCL
jgi:hypothetical protein